MIRRSLGLLSMAVACTAIMGIGISSCDSNSPTTPGVNTGNNSGKGPQVLDGNCLSAVAMSNCASGEAVARYDEDGYMQVSNLNGDDAALTTSFENPINVWNAKVSVGFAASGGALSYSAQDDAGNVEAKLDIAQQQGRLAVRPTFTSPPDGGRVSYDVRIYDANGNLTGSADRVAITTPIVGIPDCNINLIQATGWSVYQLNSQCVWKVLTNPCCRVRWVLPDGTIADGSKITLTERNEKGIYVYLETKTITTTGTTLANYAVQASTAFRSVQ